MNLILPRGLIYILAAGVVGLLATFAIHRYVTVKTTVPPVASGQVVVATTDISPGNALNGSMIKVSSWPRDLIPNQAASSQHQVDGRVLLTPITRGEPILMTKLAPEGTASGLSGLLDESKRALTVRVDDVSGVAGFIHPGDRVDVLADVKVSEGKDNFCKTILQNILVMTTGQIWEQKGESKPVVVNTVTLEVTPDQAEVLNLASNEGKIRLALRNRRNLAQVQTEGVALSNLVTPNGKKPNDPAPRSNGRTVEVIKGVDRTQVTL